MTATKQQRVMEAFRVANADRSTEAAAIKVAAAREAIKTIKATTPRNKLDAHQQLVYTAVLRMRVTFPDATLAEVADRMRMTKDCYSSRFRRALAYAAKRDAHQHD